MGFKDWIAPFLSDSTRFWCRASSKSFAIAEKKLGSSGELSRLVGLTYVDRTDDPTVPDQLRSVKRKLDDITLTIDKKKTKLAKINKKLGANPH